MHPTFKYPKNAFSRSINVNRFFNSIKMHFGFMLTFNQKTRASIISHYGDFM